MKHLRRIIWLLFLLLTAGILLALVSHGPRTAARETSAEGRSFTILTYNTHRMGLFRKPEHNRVIHYIRRANADIVCLQEVEVYKDNKYLTLPELRDAMRRYPYTYYDFKVYNKRRQFGNVVFSRFPLTAKQTVRYSSRSNISSRCDVVIEKDTLRLIVNHLESNRFTRSDFQLPDSLSGENIRASAAWAQRISEKLESARAIRHGQARAVREEIEESPYPVVVVGDFNSTPLSYAYWHIRAGLRDAFLESPWGHLGNTYVRHHLGIRIDYILCSRTITTSHFRLDKVDYSDHYPISATLTLTP